VQSIEVIREVFRSQGEALCLRMSVEGVEGPADEFGAVPFEEPHADTTNSKRARIDCDDGAQGGVQLLTARSRQTDESLLKASRPLGAPLQHDFRSSALGDVPEARDPTHHISAEVVRSGVPFE